MVKDVRCKADSNRILSGLSPDRHWSPVPKGPRVLPKLRDTVATFLFAARPQSEFQSIPRDIHRDTHAGQWHGQPHRLSQTRHCLQQYLHTGLTKIKAQTPKTPCSLTGRGWISLIQAYT